ncbi:S8 family serine peptidase [Actinoplanes sp. NPDC051633]|uniref:S8 family serine peptidase n=1 Tax=Actinoplanes sp. NPDC051633 TaxID=3155670 RepID=UPI003443C533
MRRPLLAATVATATVVALSVSPITAATAAPSAPGDYTVVSADGVPAADAVAAITAAGGTIVSRNDAVGVFRVSSTDAGFRTAVAGSSKLIGASERKAFGYAPKDLTVEAPATGANAPAAAAAPALRTDPLDEKLWGQRMIRADMAHKIQKGNRGVTVGVLDTGLDASNPDLAKRFSPVLSRNFAPDIPAVDGPCEVASCLDPVGTDDGGHGTHVAGIIGASLDGSGLSGVAPGVTLVELKGGQDFGLFFLDPVVNALTYAGDAGIDVVNMSFYVDPWLYNCKANPADSPEAQAEQRAIIAGMRRALNYAHRKGVTLVAALGNNHEDLGKPRIDSSSPDYGGTPYDRPIDNRTCWDLPAEGPHVIGVSSVGPSKMKSDFSNYGVEQTSVAAPGGWARDGFGTPTYLSPGNQILSTYPLKILQAAGRVDADGNITPAGAPNTFKACNAAGECGYYGYLQGTSMAAPHAAGVAALIVSQYGRPDQRNGGLTLNPDVVERRLLRSAAETPCPTPRLRSYVQEGRDVEFDAFCEGGTKFNGFYGHGIVDAYAAVGGQ